MLLTGLLQLGLCFLISPAAKVEYSHIHPGIFAGGIDEKREPEVPFCFIVLPQSPKNGSEIREDLDIIRVRLLYHPQMFEGAGVGPNPIEKSGQFAPRNMVVGVEA
jgi:hypothetical protein